MHIRNTMLAHSPVDIVIGCWGAVAKDSSLCIGPREARAQSRCRSRFIFLAIVINIQQHRSVMAVLCITSLLGSEMCVRRAFSQYDWRVSWLSRNRYIHTS